MLSRNIRLNVLHKVLRIFQNPPQESVNFNLLQLVVLRHGGLGAHVWLHSLAVRTESVRVGLHRENMLPAHPVRWNV